MTRVTQAVKVVVEESSKPLPKWVGVAGAVLVALGVVGHNQLVVTFGGGKFGNWAANAIPVLGAIFSTLAHSLGGKGGD